MAKLARFLLACLMLAPSLAFADGYASPRPYRALFAEQVTQTPAPFITGSGAFTPAIFGPSATGCTAGAIPYSFTGDTDTGFSSTAADAPTLCAGGVSVLGWASNTLSLVNSTNPQSLYVYSTFTSATNYERGALGVWSGSRFTIGMQKGSGGGAYRDIDFQNADNAAWRIAATTGDLQAVNNLGPAITAGSGTGITVNSSGSLREVVYKVTVASTAFICAAVTCDLTVATLPAKTQITAVMADLTTTFACAATCTTSTLSMIFGRGAAGAQWLASFDADAAAAQFGDADAELGTTMTRAAAIQAGSFEVWASTQAAVLRLTSGTGNIGTGAATNLSQGTVVLYLVTRVLP